MWRSEQNFQGSPLSFRDVGPGDRTQGLRLDVKPLFPLTHIWSLSFMLLNMKKESSGCNLETTDGGDTILSDLQATQNEAWQHGQI